MCTPVCRVCLGRGVRMQGVEDSQLLEIYEKLTGDKLNAGDGRPSVLCYICSSLLQRCRRFSDMAHRSDKFLKDLLQNDMKVSHETVSALKIQITHLTVTPLRCMYFDGYSIDGSTQMMNEVAVKQESTALATPKRERNSSTEDFDSHNNIEDMSNTVLSYRCNECQYISMTKKALIAHLGTHRSLLEVNIKADKASDSKVPGARCKVCNKTFSERKALKLHASVHTGAKPFVCDQCTQPFRLKQSLQNHITVHHTRVKRFVCDICSKSFFHKKGLIAHKKSPKCHRPTYEPYACKTCDSTFADVHSLRQHKRTHVGERRFGCNRCDKAFTVKSYLTKHVVQVHSPDTPFPCHRCSKTFKQLSTLKIHMRIHTKDELFACPVCGKTFLYNSTLKRHASRHTSGTGVTRPDDWPYCCDRCSKKFRSKASLKAHLRTHTGEKPFSCDTCGKRFSQKGNLQLHMKIHFGEKSFACEICGKTFLLKCQLKIHYQVHSEEKPYACSRCEMTFTFKSALKEHVRRLHSEVKAFACSKCGKSFDQECTLARHTRRHTAERVYSCNKCSKCYTTAENLKRHVAIHSEETPYACDTCKKAFKILRYLQQHRASARCRARAGLAAQPARAS